MDKYTTIFNDTFLPEFDELEEFMREEMNPVNKTLNIARTILDNTVGAQIYDMYDVDMMDDYDY